MDEHKVIRRFLRRLYAKGKLSMADMYSAVLEPEQGEELAVESALFLENAVWKLIWPVVLPFGEPLPAPLKAVDLTEEQQDVLDDWADNFSGDWADSHGEGKYAVLDSIKWKFGDGWRRRYTEIA